jgi:tetratricopeptide (TPR) repeat protein
MTQGPYGLTLEGERMRLAIAALIVVATCAAARADDVVKAQAAYHAATQHYDLGEYREALEGFKEAYRNHEDPSFLFNIAQCHRQLDEKQQAIRAYRTYLIKEPESPKRDQIREMIAKLEKQLADEQAAKGGPPQGTLSPVETPPPSSETKPPSPPEPARVESAPVETKPPEHAPVEPSSAAISVKPAPERPAKPLYKRWWLWTAVGAAVVVGVAVGVGVGVGTAHAAPTPSAKTDFGTFRF